MCKEKVTLQQAMEAVQDGVVVHIGSKSSFFFIGTKEEYEANIDFVQQDLQATKMEFLHRSRRQAEALMKKIAHSNSETGTEKHWNQLADWAKNLSRLCDYIPVLEDYLDTFVAIRKREVVDQYDRIQKDGVVIVVTGKEIGRFWDYDEYKQGIAAEDMEGEGKF